jgi:hypothetical protein
LAFSKSFSSDLELKYPFAPRSRRFFETIPLDEVLASKDVVAQAKNRLLSSLARGKYEPTSTDTDLSSFFAGAFVACQDPVLTSKFSKKEAERAKEFFKEEKPEDKVVAMVECFGVAFQTERSDTDRASYSVPFERYLILVSKHELTKNPVWKLARQSLDKGVIRMSDNMLNDLFGDCAHAAISEGIRNLRRAPLPKQLIGVKMEVIQYAPSPKPRTNKGYMYIETLLQNPISDGRHRISWLILSPWAIAIRGLSDDQAIELIQNYVSAGGNMDSGIRRFIAYNVRRARRLGLMPPTLNKLKTEHPDVYALLPKEVVAAHSEAQQSGRKSTVR